MNAGTVGLWQGMKEKAWMPLWIRRLPWNKSRKWWGRNSNLGRPFWYSHNIKSQRFQGKLRKKWLRWLRTLSVSCILENGISVTSLSQHRKGCNGSWFLPLRKEMTVVKRGKSKNINFKNPGGLRASLRPQAYHPLCEWSVAIKILRRTSNDRWNSSPFSKFKVPLD